MSLFLAQWVIEIYLHGRKWGIQPVFRFMLVFVNNETVFARFKIIKEMKSTETDILVKEWNKWNMVRHLKIFFL
jgi:hypothetical protein